MLMRLSQGQLNVLEACPRKFQHLYLDQLSSPLPLAQQESLNWGSQFHLRMQQQTLGLPINLATTDEVVLEQSVQALMQAAPEIFQKPAPPFRQSEHRISIEFQSYLLTAVYDLLILDDSSARILDWKTYPKPQQARWLQQNWQTRLYPFILAESSSYLPEQISMTYWFVQSTTDSRNPTREPQSLQFRHSTPQHEQTRQDLSHLLSQLTTWLQDYSQGIPFKQIDEAESQCATCSFATRCERDGSFSAFRNTHDLSNLENIQEVPI